jgi:hypothetical protein
MTFGLPFIGNVPTPTTGMKNAVKRIAASFSRSVSSAMGPTVPRKLTVRWI